MVHTGTGPASAKGLSYDLPTRNQEATEWHIPS